MPTRPPSPCTAPGCPRHSTTGGRCADHQRKAWASTTGSAHSRGYGATWRKLRTLKLASDPVCEYCHQALALEVDHKKPKAEGGTDDWDNLASTCSPCHKAKTEREAKEARTS